MAILHQAELRPTKLELLAHWLPARNWFRGEAGGELTRVSAFRFDDPAGEVGVETFLARAGDGPVMQVPLTYRGAPLEGAEGFLVGTMEHSVLGSRWVYDACGDPVYATVLAAAIFGGTGEAEEFVDVDGKLVPREPAMSVSGNGSGDVPVIGGDLRVDDGDPTLIVAGKAELTVVRVLDTAAAHSLPSLTLTGTWPGQTSPVTLAHARLR